MEKMDGFSADIRQEQMQKLCEIFPEVFDESKIDWDKLRLTLGESISDRGNRYGLDWKGKSEVFAEIQTRTSQTLKPVPEKSKNWDDTQNLFIEGDNLAALKILQKSYCGKVKMIYIDPPYNTGNDFIYSDKFSQTKREYLEETGNIDGDGLTMRTDGLRKNSKESGHFHSNWLSMMYPRLFLARNLLRSDGVIFVSIDDNEVANLHLIMDEIFGSENFVSDIIVRSNPRGSQEPFGVSREHEYILCYAKSEDGIMSIVGQARGETDQEFNFSLDNGKKARLLGLRKRGGDWRREDRPNMFYPIYINPGNGRVSLTMTDEHSVEVFPKRPDGQESRWTWGAKTAAARVNELYGKEIIRNRAPSYDIFRIDPLKDENGDAKREKLKSVWLDKEMNYQSARQYIKELFGSSDIFDFPKPPEIIKKLLSSLREKDGIVLDFFAGSGTTAHAVMEQNAEDGGDRRWILVQLPEKTNEKLKAFKEGYNTISEISLERIRRAGAKIGKGDVGFRFHEVANSNFKKWNEKPEDASTLRQQMFDHIDPLICDVRNEDLLTELLLKNGISPMESIEDHDGYYYVPSANLAICLARDITSESFGEILSVVKENSDNPKIILLDLAFSDNSQLKTNTLLQAEENSVNVEIL